MAEFDTSNATATPGDILNGKTAYANGEKIKGTIQSKLGGAFTPATESQIICPTGVYTSSAFSVKGDANLKPQNIKDGVGIFGVVGTYKVDTPSGTLPNGMRTITVQPDNPKGGAVHGGGAAQEGMTVTVSATSNAPYSCYGWKERGEVVTNDAEYTFTVDKSRDLTAIFSITPIHPLPDGYTEVNWIQNADESSYLHISVSGNGYCRLHVSFPDGVQHYVQQRIVEFPYTISSYPQLDRVDDHAGVFEYWYQVRSSSVSTGYMLVKKELSPNITDDKIYEISVSSPSSAAYSSIGSAYIPASTSSLNKPLRIHYVVLGGHEFIPCISPDDVVGLYDLQGKQFIAPERGAFIAGRSLSDIKYYTVSCSVNPQFAGIVTGDGTYEEGTKVTVSVKTIGDYDFLGWEENGQTVSNSAEYTFTAEKDRSLVARLKAIPVYTIQTAVNPVGSGIVKGNGQHKRGDTVTLSATANTGYAFNSWTENNQLVQREPVYTFTAEKDRSLIANFIRRYNVGVDWWVSSIPLLRFWESVAYGNGKFVAVCNGGADIAYSNNGVNWLSKANAVPNDYWKSIVYGWDKFVAIAGGNYYSQKAVYSSDGINWNETTLPYSSLWGAVSYGSGKYVAVSGSENRAAYSSDGVQWFGASIPTKNGASNMWRSIAYGGGKFVAVSYMSNVAAYSTNGIDWVLTSIPVSATYSYVAYGDGKFVAVASNSNTVAYSSNGIDWSVANLPITDEWDSVAYGDGKFVAVASGSLKSVYSEDGVVWNANALPYQSDWRSIAYGNGTFVVVGTDTVSLYSRAEGSEE